MASPGARTRLRAVSGATVAILAVTGTETFRGTDILESILDYTSRTPPQARSEAAFEGKRSVGYFVIL
jgi:hypothetical protein